LSCLQNDSKAQIIPKVTVGNTHSMLTNQRYPLRSSLVA
jgi:hypothetical protein